ncbi:MAG: cation:proton antiporter, partial [Bacilli bacterium]|nr:cation:proton antiporter [Bacilli bacterium]
MDNLIFLYFAFILLVGLLSTRLMKWLKMPNVTGFIVTGILIGPFVFGLLFNNFDFLHAKDGIIYQYIQRIHWVSDIALGFIAFVIGSSFKLSSLRQVGKRVMVITALEALGASLLVFLALLTAYFIFPESVPLPLVFTLSAIASATAPAATLMVIKQYHARGPVTRTLLPVVALDDAAALILFAILFQIAKAIGVGSGFDPYAMFLKPLIEVALSIAFGLFLGLIISLACRLFLSRTNRLIWACVAVFASVGLYYLFKMPELGGFELSSLLTCMASGAVFVNMRNDSAKTFEFMDRFTAP